MNTEHDEKWKHVYAFLRNQGLSLFSLLLVLALAAGAFALSYAGLKDLASTNGVDPRLVWIWPLVLDGAIIVFSVCAFRAGLCGESIAYPMFLVVLSTLASIAFNVLHAPVPEGATLWSKAALVPRIMASIPPLALFLSFEVMIRQLQSQVRHSQTRPEPEPEEAPPVIHAQPTRAIEEEVEPVGMGGMFLGMQTPEPATARAIKSEEPAPKFVTEKKEHHSPPKDAAEAKAIVIEMCKEGALLEEMAEAANRAPRTVKRYLHEAGLSVPMARPSKQTVESEE
ncbi:MAG: DUF2637 domain-containing protein [Verrucomicrobiales bacterium]|nr:DUF2637 domain-containing protein [Verrucomicrobiales bacterium]